MALAGWHVKNPYYTNTGIFVADGDEFKISWSGDYSYIESDVLFENSAGQFLSDSNILEPRIHYSHVLQILMIPPKRLRNANTTSIFLQNERGEKFQLVGEIWPERMPQGLE
ncbi:MAG: hypothetical protein IRD7MM_02135 [Candidatus Midichloria mitochondrii]|nr:hypothetical protein [Candidatus Midichloria mitochondrii]MDJ1256853.1 hypothetical protein [Candidatus Midichloria mitochondrii]MDJ1288604.1 hypothetical protein [Candidatus Midichloria mitochondrii]MDJ1299007.1 hypothetical protein [Candidatus Midichloria mitochondrii]MDJ1313170.1 hypothetical protein [Candidatus Midichloria mitochondrii]MDJ1583721.1 hypothetical protein [Candidatus Midichloria mitochondrii]